VRDLQTNVRNVLKLWEPSTLASDREKSEEKSSFPCFRIHIFVITHNQGNAQKSLERGILFDADVSQNEGLTGTSDEIWGHQNEPEKLLTSAKAKKQSQGPQSPSSSSSLTDPSHLYFSDSLFWNPRQVLKWHLRKTTSAAFPERTSDLTLSFSAVLPAPFCSRFGLQLFNFIWTAEALFDSGCLYICRRSSPFHCVNDFYFLLAWHHPFPWNS
jgi:hypothetical protein